jgi:hypothetical protein
MPKSPPPFPNSRYSDFFIKWMSRINRVIPLVACEP